MAEIPESAIGEVKSTASAMSLAHQEDDRSRREASDGFVAIDIETLSILSTNKGKDSTSSPRVHMAKHLSRKGSQRSGGAGGERKAAEGQLTTNSPTGGPGMNVKSALSMHVAGQEEPSEFSRAITPTAAAGGMCRRQGRRQTPWIDPMRVLFLFATLSSMGTLILLYLTLSMGKMAGSDTNAP